MKRVLSILLCLMLCFSLVACSDPDDGNGNGNEDPGGGIQMSGDVDVTLPASMVDSEMDIDEYVAEQRFNSADLNEDGSLTVNMSAARHSELLSDMRTVIDDSFKEMMEEESTAYIESVDYSNDLREFTVTVEREGYDNAILDMIPTLIRVQAMFYQMMANEEEGVTIHMVYSDTGEEFDTISYPGE